jgi:hypothetical protein
MSASTIYNQVYELLDQHLGEQVSESSRQRITLLVLGIIRAKSASPARIAEALSELGLTNATTESIERRIRRIENDDELTATLCFHPFAKERLAFGRPEQGRALPLAWLVWPANVPLEGDGFWERIEKLLDTVATILPNGVSVTWLADRAFGTPAFTDLVTGRGWCYVVRAQGHTKCEDIRGICCKLEQLVRLRGKRAKLRGRVFKKRGWRDASVVVYWGRRHEKPLCLVSNLPPRWYLIHLYRRRYPIEAMFRDYKSHGWHWEQGQVTDLEHIERLLCGMALATWIALLVGTQVATEHLSKPPTGRRRSVPWVGKRSLFRLGLQRLLELLSGSCQIDIRWQLSHWDAPNWQQQIYFHHARAFVFALR